MLRAYVGSRNCDGKKRNYRPSQAVLFDTVLNGTIQLQVFENFTRTSAQVNETGAANSSEHWAFCCADKKN